MVLHRVLRMQLKDAKRVGLPGRPLEHLRHVQQQTAAPPNDQVVHGRIKLASEQEQLFAALGVPTPKASSSPKPTSPPRRMQTSCEGFLAH